MGIPADHFKDIEVNMTVYYINQLLILGLAFPLCLYKPNKIKKAAYLAVTFGYMWFLATFRVGIGFDYLSYIDIFVKIKAAPDLSAAFDMMYEPGFELLTWVMTRFVTSPVMMYGVYSAIIFIPVAVFIFCYSRDVWLSTWMYMTLSYFYSSMNFIRQNIACGILLLGYKFLREKKPVPYLCIVLLGACFHKTALIMIPIYFLSHLRLGKKTGIFYACATLIGYLTSTAILNFITSYPFKHEIFRIFQSYKDSRYIDPAYGFSLTFLIVPFVIFGACLALRPIWEKRDPDANMLLNMMLFSSIMWLFITRHFIIERFSHYAYLLALVAIPSALACLQSSREDYALLAELEAKEKQDGKGGKSKGKAELNQVRQLRQNISDHKKYYWSAVVALLLITGIYNEFGQHVNNFHNVFPYQSVFETEGPDFSNYETWELWA